MAGKSDRHTGYEVHGEGIESLREGFARLAMPANRHREALTIVREVSDANGASTLRWYMPPVTPEICGYWDDSEVNQLWITSAEVHIAATTARPKLPLTWSKQDGDYVGWLLPGAESGSGGGPQKAKVAETRCPTSFLLHPTGTACPDCDVVHD